MRKHSGEKSNRCNQCECATMHLHLRPDIRSLSSCEQAESTLVTLLGVDCYGEAGALCELQCCRRRQLSAPLSTRSLVNMHPLPLSDAKDILTRPTILCWMQLVGLEKAWETHQLSLFSWGTDWYSGYPGDGKFESIEFSPQKRASNTQFVAKSVLSWFVDNFHPVLWLWNCHFYLIGQLDKTA